MLRQYAAEKLEIDPANESDIRGKHSHYFCQALAVWERDLQGPRQAAAMQEMKVEINNIWAAWAWALDNAKAKTLLSGLNGLFIFLDRNHQLLEGEKTCRAILERFDTLSVSEQSEVGSLDDDSTDPIDFIKLQARALSWGSSFNYQTGNKDLSQKLIQNGLSLFD